MRLLSYRYGNTCGRNHLLELPLSLSVVPMGSCCSKQTAADLAATATPVASRQERPGIRTPESNTTLGPDSESPRVKDVPMHDLPRNRSKSTPQKPPHIGVGEALPPVPSFRSRAKSSHASASSSRSPSTPVSAGEHGHRRSA
jgi:hypothetical protein